MVAPTPSSSGSSLGSTSLLPAVVKEGRLIVQLDGINDRPIKIAVEQRWNCWQSWPPTRTHAQFTVLIDNKPQIVWLEFASIRSWFNVSQWLIDDAAWRNELMRVVCKPLLIQCKWSQIIEWSRNSGEAFHFSRKRYGLKNSVYVNGDFVALGTSKEDIVEVTNSKIKPGQGVDGESLVRKSYIIPDWKTQQKVGQFLATMELLKENPHVLPLRGVVQYVTKTHRKKVAFFHPRMEGDLLDRLRAADPFSPQERIDLARWLFKALLSLNGAHGDLKPDNILLNKGQYFLCDLEDYRREGKRGVHEGGTFLWSPPEVLDDSNATVTQKLDVWSLGLILYCLFTHPEGSPFPWQRNVQQPILTPQEIREMRQLITQKAVQKHLEQSDLPPELEELLRKMIVVNIAERYTMQEAADHFNRLYPDSRR